MNFLKYVSISKNILMKINVFGCPDDILGRFSVIRVIFA